MLKRLFGYHQVSEVTIVCSYSKEVFSIDLRTLHRDDFEVHCCLYLCYLVGNATYYSKTNHSFQSQNVKSPRNSRITRERVKDDEDFQLENFFFPWSLVLCLLQKLASMEILLIDRGHPPLNKNEQSLHFELFDN